MDEEKEEEILIEYSSSRCWSQSFTFPYKGVPFDLCTACGDNSTTPILAFQDPKQFHQPKKASTKYMCQVPKDVQRDRI